MSERKCIIMNDSELELASVMLNMAADTFGNHGCNDFNLPTSWSQDKCDEFNLALETWNGTPENYEPGKRTTMDCSVMSYLAYKLQKKIHPYSV